MAVRLTVATVLAILAGTVGLIGGVILQVQSPGIWITTGACALAGFLGSFFARQEN